MTLIQKAIDIAKRAGLFFLIILIIGFVFNQSLLNHFIPKVYFMEQIEGERLEKSFEVEGIIKPKKVSPIRVAGDILIDELYVKSGTYVHAGDPLFKINVDYGLITTNKGVLGLEEQVKAQVNVILKIKGQVEAQNLQIDLLKDALNQSLSDLEKTKALYQASSVSKSVLESEEMRYKQAQINYKSALQSKENLKREITIQEENLSALKSQEGALTQVASEYYQIDEEGICIALKDGVLLSIDQTFQVIPFGKTIGEFAELSSYEDVYFEAKVDERYVDRIGMFKTLNFEVTYDEVPFEVQIVGKDFLSENGKIRITGEIKNKTGKPFLNQYLEGKVVEKSYYYKRLLPKYCVIVEDGMIEAGDFGSIYIIEKNEGILGTEYIARKQDVIILDVGDTNVAIEPFDNGEKPWVITNISYDLYDGKRILVMQD